MTAQLRIKLCLAALLALPCCNTYDESLIPGLGAVCLWIPVTPVTKPATDNDPAAECYRVTAPEHARVSPVPLDPCDAADLGLEVVVVRKGEPVYRYSEPDLNGPGAYRATAVACGE